SLLGDLSHLVKFTDQRDAKSRRCFDMDVIVQSFIQDKAEMRRLGTITVGIISLIVVLLYSIVEISLRILYVLTDLGQISQLQRSAVGINNLHQINPIEMEVVVLHLKFPRRKVKGLLDQVNIFIH